MKSIIFFTIFNIFLVNNIYSGSACSSTNHARTESQLEKYAATLMSLCKFAAKETHTVLVDNNFFILANKYKRLKEEVRTHKMQELKNETLKLIPEIQNQDVFKLIFPKDTHLVARSILEQFLSSDEHDPNILIDLIFEEKFKTIKLRLKSSDSSNSQL